MADENTDEFKDSYPQGLLQRLLFGNASGESPADTALNRAGSVMGSAKTGPREQAEAQGPLMTTLMQMLQAGGLDPSTMSGPSNAMLGPIARTGNKLLDQTQKKIVKSMFKHDPESLMAASMIPEPVNINTLGISAKTPLSEFAKDPRLKTINPNWAAWFTPKRFATQPDPAINYTPNTLKSQGPQGTTYKDVGSSFSDIGGHELQHFLNEHRIFKDFNLHHRQVLELVDLIYPMLGQHARGAVNKELYSQSRGPKYALTEALSYLSGKSTRNKHLEDLGAEVYNLLKVKPDMTTKTSAPISRPKFGSPNPYKTEEIPLGSAALIPMIEDLIRKLPAEKRAYFPNIKDLNIKDPDYAGLSTIP